MQREEPNINMPGAFKSSRGDGHTNATSTDSSNAASASAMRAASGNPQGQTYQVAGPTIGGIPTPYDSHNIENAKEHLAQSVSGGDKDVSSTSGHALKSSITDNIIHSASTAATGAATTGASVIAAARKLISNDDEDEFTEQGATNSQKDQQGLEFSQQKKVNPADRPPSKITIHAMKPSDKAIYGDLDSPGAHNMPGPLSDRVKVGTPPVVDTNATKTIADPFGPLNVANWNDGKRHDDLSTPTSEDFESYLDTKPLHHAPVHSSTMPNQTGASSATHGHSALKNEAAHVASDPSRNILPDTHMTVHTLPRNEAPAAPTAVKTSNNAALTGTGAGAGAVGAGIAAASMHHDDHIPISHPVSQTTTATTVPAAQAPQIKKIPIAQPPIEAKQIPIAQPPSDVKRIPIAQPPSQVEQHPIENITDEHVPMYRATTPHTHATMPIATATAAGTAAAMHDAHAVPVVEKATAGTEKITSPIADVAGRAPGFIGIKSFRDPPITHTTSTMAPMADADPMVHSTAPVVSKVPASVAHKLTRTTIEHEPSRPLSEKATASLVGAAAGTAAYTGAKKEQVKDTIHETAAAVNPTEHVKHSHRHAHPTKASGGHHYLPSETIAVPLTSAAIGASAYISQKEDMERESRLHHDIPVVKAATDHHSASEYGPANPNDLYLEDPSKIRHLGTPVAAVVVSPDAAIGAKEVVKEAKTITSSTHTRVPDSRTAVSVPAAHTTAATTDRHSASEYGPANPNDLYLEDPSKIRHLGTPVAAAVVSPDAAIGAKEVVKEAKTITSTTHTRVPDSRTAVSVPAAHTTAATTDRHSASEYGPANPNDLYLEDPSKIRHLGTPVAAVVVSPDAAIGAKEVVKEAKTITSHTTHTAPATHVESVKPGVAPTTAAYSTTPHKTAISPMAARALSSSSSDVDVPITTTTSQPLDPNVSAKSTTTTHKAAPLAGATIAAAAAAPLVASAYHSTAASNIPGNSVPAAVSNTTTSTSYPINASTISGTNNIASTTGRKPSAVEIESADKIAAAIPAAYKGPIPTVHPGEKVIWVKTVTTTDFYDDETAGIIDRNGDVVSTQQDVLEPNAYATARDSTTTYTNANSAQNLNPTGVVGGRRRSTGFMDRLLGRHHSPDGDKGKQRT